VGSLDCDMMRRVWHYGTGSSSGARIGVIRAGLNGEIL
jgi:hypothetical protein